MQRSIFWQGSATCVLAASVVMAGCGGDDDGGGGTAGTGSVSSSGGSAGAGATGGSGGGTTGGTGGGNGGGAGSGGSNQGGQGGSAGSGGTAGSGGAAGSGGTGGSGGSGTGGTGGASSTPCSYGAWSFAEVTNTYGPSAVDVDSKGVVHHISSQGSVYTLQYRKLPPGGSFALQTLPTSGKSVSAYVYVDPQDGVHVPLPSGVGAPSDLIHGYLAVGKSWTQEKIGASAGTTISWARPAIARESNGTLHVLLADASVGQIRHASKGAGQGWTVTSVETYPQKSGSEVAMAIDAKGNLHGLYQTPTGAVRYASRAPGAAWKTQTVQAVTGNSSSWSALFVDKQDNVHVAYNLQNNHDIRYGYRAAGASQWTLTTLKSGNQTSMGTGIVVGSEGTIHACYSVLAPGAKDNKMYCSIKPPGGTWSSAEVDSIAGMRTSIGDLALGDDDSVHIAYNHIKVVGTTLTGTRRYAKRACNK